MQVIGTASAPKDAAVGRPRATPKLVRSLGWSIPAVLAATLWHSPAAGADTLFDNLAGSWAGSGQIRYDDGQAEGIRCTAYYTGGGEKLRLAIRCRSTTTEVEIRGQLAARGGKLTGTWEERTFNASGEASGSVTGNKMSLFIGGGGFSGAMSVTYAGAKQVVTISTEGIRMRSVNVTLGKS